ncbi:Cytoplasmic dynein 2 heavy chain 1 [Lobulomyces angularis]|nr:Cytoplasmic dynein 2 heavy chain 1 [Lobulomyces angularis]
MEDPRLSWIQKMLQLQLDMKDQQNFLNQTNKLLPEFLDNLNANFKVLIQEKSGAISLSNELESIDQTSKYVLLTKNNESTPLTSENIKDLVNVTSLTKTPLNTFYQSIHSVFAPVLLKNSKWGVNTKLQGLISDLDSDLGSVVRNGLDQASKFGAISEADFNAIKSLSEEYLYWSEQSAKYAKSKQLKERALVVKNILEPLKNDFELISVKNLEFFLEPIDKMQDILDDLWKEPLQPPYPENRMKHLFSMIGDQIVASMQEKLSAHQLMTDPLNKRKEDLILSIQICENLDSLFSTLTSKFWPRFVANPWKSENFEHLLVKQFLERIKQIVEIKTIFEHLSNLFSADEQKDLRLEKLMLIFQPSNPLLCNNFHQKNWQNVVAQFNQTLIPIEEKVATKLRNIFSNLQNQPSQLLREFQKYGVLIKRESVSKNLLSEKEILLSQLTIKLKSTSAELKEFSQISKESKGKNLPLIVNNLVWATQSLLKVEETNQLVGFLIGQNTNFQKQSLELDQLLQNYKKDQFEEWSQETLQELERPDSILTLDQTGKLMELDFEDGKLKVNFDDKLVTLLRQVRQLVSLGFSVSLQIQQAATLGEKYYRHAVVLKQVANFYNTIDQQMLPCQQGMLLDLALEFERLVKNPKGESSGKKQNSALKWDSPVELEKYIFKLQEVTQKLTSKNRTLRKYHELITEQVLQLINVDLVKHQQKCKEILNNMRSIVNSLEQSGVSSEDTLAWRTHWDFQLYKTLEYQYKLGMESMNESLPEIKVDLIFKQQKLQFRPSFEEIRAKYYREMKKFINIPASFRGLSESKIFSKMIELNDNSLLTVYKKAEILFQNLLKVQDLFKDWVILGTVNLDDFVEEALVDVSDWELNFRILKGKGKEAEQLPTQIQVDCITVSTLPVKAAIDDHLQALMDSMLAALRTAVTRHMASIEDFAGKGLEVLNKKPQSLAEIGLANSQHEELIKNKSLIQSHFVNADKKNKLLKSVIGSGVDTSAMQSKWNKLELMLEGHELMIKEQMEVFRTAINTRVQAAQNDVDKFLARWKQLKPKVNDIKNKDSALKAIKFVIDKKTEFEELVKVISVINEDCHHFGLALPEYLNLEVLKNDIGVSEEMWGSFGSWLDSIANILKEDWITFRSKIHVLEDLLSEWTSKIQAQKVNSVSAHIQKEIDTYKSVLPSLKFVRGDTWTSEHWAELFHILSIPKGVSVSELNVGHFLAASAVLIKRVNEIKELNNRALGEVSIREAIQELDIWGAGSTFVLTDYEDVKGTKLKLIKDWKETLAQIGDNQSLLQSLKDSPYYRNFADKASAWEGKLAELDEVLRNLNTVQRKWVYLEPIFSRGSLPSEEARFSRIDDDFRSVMASVNRDNRVVSILSFTGLRSMLIALVDQLERCQKALNEFLEEKRTKFARFYFLGDEDLLEILGQAKNPNVIQSHLKKLFAGVHNVKFDATMTSIVAMMSLEGEVVSLQTPVKVTEDVEIWLQNFTEEMRSTLKYLLNKCLEVNEVFKFPSQILGLAEYLHFTAKCEAAIVNGGLSTLSSELKAQLGKYTTFNYQTIKDVKERKVIELKVKSLILDIIHLVDVIQQLQDQKVTSVNDWIWQKQLRFYMNKDNACVCRMHDAEFQYTFEYQGNPIKLVHTPLTDKCYLTLTQAMASGFGGNPFGPAGTGKTESVKALAVMMGRQCLVFNCDEGIDYKSMGRIFVGLVNCGAWGCFDEFNRLEESVLSAVSQQIQVIQAGLKTSQKSIALLGKTVDLDPNSGIFVTLNPAGKGYGGRQKLPDNLKQLFRSVAMTHPNNDLIAEVILFSEGFKQGKELGGKVVAVFVLCKQLLSAQQHYEWGLRPLKSTLWLAGNLLGEEIRKGAVSDKRETEIVVKALRVNTLSKLTFSDSKRFNALMNDVFPKVQTEDINYAELSKYVKESYLELNLIYNDTQAEKIFQFYEACRQRMGVVIVGPSGSGKSVLWKVLRLALSKCGQKLKHFVMNPKSIDRQTLLGHMDMDTREWSDGIITYASRQAVKESVDTKTWIICDGDVDPEWVESLNSVLDDNRLLTMPNGERIQFGPNVNFIFETHNLKFASPATVSRMGMIFLSDETIDIPALVKAWIIKIPEKNRVNVTDWINSYFYKSLSWISQNSELAVNVSKVGVVLNGLSHLLNVPTKLNFLNGLIRGFGSNLLIETRLAFANEVYSWGNEKIVDPKKALSYFVDEKGKLTEYQLKLPKHLEQSSIQDPDRLPVIETLDVQQVLDIIGPWIHEGESFVLVGPEGCGKHMILRHCFAKERSLAVATIHCSSQTRSLHILRRIQQYCIGMNTNTGRILRPKDSEKLILYLKDINLPSPDKYETVELVQFLQQLLIYKGFYDSNLEWVGIENVQVVCSMNPSTTIGRHELSTRFTSVIRQCYVSYGDDSQLELIYRILLQPVIQSCLSKHPVWILPKNIQKLASTIVKIYSETKSSFTVDMYPHYIFTPRDISRLITGFPRYNYASDNQEELLNIVAYESLRIFQDKLVGQDAKQKFLDILKGTLQSEWNYKLENSDSYFTTLAFNPQPRSGTKFLSEVSGEVYSQAIGKEIHVFERDVKDLQLCLFKDVLERISRMERGKVGGSLLLAGRPGVGRLSTVEVACHMLKLKTVSPQVGRNYNMKQFSIDLKNLLQTAGVLGEEVVLIFEDYQLVEPSILESINSLLSGGEVPGLYAQDELEAILGNLKSQHSEEGLRCTLFEYFLSRIQKNLHVVLLFDSADQKFVSYCESNPALYTRCHMEWATSWSPESMQVIVNKTMSTDESLKDIADREAITSQLILIHEYMAKNHGATPKHLLEYVGTYRQIYNKQKFSSQEKFKYLNGGLGKMNEASKFVDNLSVDAKKQSQELAEKQKLADQALKYITESMMNASEQKKEMETLSHQLKIEEDKMLTRKSAIQNELMDVEPIVKAAKLAVGEIKSESLTEIRSLRAPPAAVRDVLEGVLRLMGNLDMSWNSMKGFLGKRSIKEEIMNFDARNITKPIRDSVQELLKQKGDSFEEANIRRSSVAAAPLAMWVKANVQYSSILEKIGPLEVDLSRLTKSLESSKARLHKLKEELSVVDQKVANLRNDFGEKTRDAELLRTSLEKSMETIKSAQGLLEKLSGEGSRWNMQTKAITESLKRLPRNALLAAAFVTYLGSTSEDIRKSVTIEWGKLIGVSGFNFLRLMSTESDQLVWKQEGLPSDELSLQNALVILNCKTTPLMVDPDGQATNWLKTHFTDQKFEVVKPHDPSFMRTVELAIRFGKTLIITEVSDIEPSLYPMLRRDLLKQGPRFVVQLGDKLVDYNENFKVYLISKQSSFAIPANACGLINEVNFTITRAGLAGQLLGLTIKHEKPELEVEKIKMLKNEDELKLQLSKLEESLLRELANSEGNILENKSLLDSLNDTKVKSISIAKSLSESRKLQTSLDAERDKFLPLSTFGSSLFFVVNDMHKLNNMYEFSLSSFLRLFEQALKCQNSSAQDGIDIRIKLLKNTLEKSTFKWVSRSIFKDDRPMFSLHLIRCLRQNLFQPNEWELFTGQILVNDIGTEKGPELQNYIPDDRHQQMRQLMTNLPQLIQNANFADSTIWIPWIKSANCEQSFYQSLKLSLTDHVSAFQKLLIVQALRPDRLLSAMTDFACKVLSIESLAPASLNIKKILDEESIPTEPILFITTPGADPSAEIRELGEKQVGTGNFFEISMGQGQGELAIEKLVDCCKEGKWLHLQNVHLVTSWLPTLEKELGLLKPNQNFRLWLTSEQHSKFPSSLLQNSLKITVEAPPGIKRNLQRVYENWGPEFINSGSVLRGQALFTLAWFHSVIQERRTYIPQGWNKFYEFSAADLRSSAELISCMCNSGKSPQWSVLHGLLENAVYGGRIDDVYDGKKLNCYLAQYFNDDVFIINGRQPNKKLSKGIVLPGTADYSAYVKLIQEIPEANNAATFGLPSNIDQTLQQTVSQSVIDQLKYMRQVDVKTQRFEKQRWIKELTPFLQIWKKINTGNDILQKKVITSTEEDPILSFFSFELISALSLVKKIHADLTFLSKVLRGNALISNDIFDLATSLMKIKTPGSWLALWEEGPENPTSFMREAMQNTISVNNWREKSAQGVLLDSPIQLSRLFNPLIFLNALRQSTSRKLQKPIDSLRLVSTWDPKEIENSVLKCQLERLYLQGCLFDGNRLSELSSSDPTLNSVPTCNIAWLPTNNNTKGKLEIPLYQSVNREKVISVLQVPCSGDGSLWILAGAAFFLSNS